VGEHAIQLSYVAATILFIVGLRRMSSPVTARGGVRWAGAGMLLAVVATLFTPGLRNFELLLPALAIGGGAAWASGRRVAMTDMPQMVALYNGMGGGAAAAIAAIELLRGPGTFEAATVIAALGALIGAVSLSGSLVAFAKLQGLLTRSWRFAGQQILNVVVLGAAAVAGAAAVSPGSALAIVAFFLLAIAYGVMMTLPIGGADMPVVISLFNAFTGVAVGLEGYVLNNAAMIIAGTVVGAAGTLLTQLMARAMNRSLAHVLFSGFGEEPGAASAGGDGKSLKPIDATDAAIMLAYSGTVIIIPGYGMAVAQAQHKIWEMAKLLEAHGVEVLFAIHPVAGRMPGHMNVLLAEAGVPYDKMQDLDEVNAAFGHADVALVIGANDVVNPSARTDASSPIYGMPILNADQAKHVIVIKRGRGTGFSGVDNALFYGDQTRMLYGDAQDVVNHLIQELKAL
jgi:NAD(P) transhydrogenase subunit beta